MSIGSAIAEKWHGFVGYLRSVPPHVWLGLAIAFITLIFIYLAWRRSNASGDTSQSVTPTDTTATTIPDQTGLQQTVPSSLPSFVSVPDLSSFGFQGGGSGGGGGYRPHIPVSAPSLENSQILAFRREELYPPPYNPVTTAPYNYNFNLSTQSVLNFRRNELPTSVVPAISQAPAGVGGAMLGDTRTEIRAAAPTRPVTVVHPAAVLTSALQTRLTKRTANLG